MNILVCSVGRRAKLIQYFKEELSKIGGEVIAVDCDSSAPALYLADKSEIVPPITNPNYIKHIMQLCEKYKITAVLSLIDPELSLFAEHKEEFEKNNIKIIVSNREVVNICFDKYLTYKYLHEYDLPVVPTYKNINEIITDIERNWIKFPIIVKPRNGSASIGISIINSVEELYAIWKDNNELIMQPFIEGEEYGVDCYIDLINYKTTNIFCKRKIKMRAGETDKSVAVYNPMLFELIDKVIQVLNPIGPIDIDCFKTDGGFIISEINPRFGGGYLHAHEMGQNFVRNIINNLSGFSNQRDIGNYSEGSVMIKFDEVMVLNSLGKLKR
ncbi:ATP-grasp domain-containing protein [Neobacillus sp. LXY-4]|uniref:ATP-grasp domain-containing protein n=1 Tax=Neobacillus sp. LXY-4 TaxID=3379826 RepID=UPI003EE3DAE0